MNDRRRFLETLGASALTALGSGLVREVEAASRSLQGISPKETARHEDFWHVVRQAYDVTADFIHLESGWFSAVAREVLEAELRNLTRLNEITSFYLRRQYDDEKIVMKRLVGELAGLSPEEFVVCRNTTEALDTVILGLELERGDEFLWCDREYPNMRAALAQRAERDGTVNRVIEIPLVPESDEEVVALYQRAITPKTKAVLVSHMIYLTGQILPVRKIADMAHARGVEVIVDAAHSFAHVDFQVKDLGADYLGTSFHKWLGAPIGAGLLHVRKEKIAKVWPLLASFAPRDDIRKFENIGTHPVSVERTLSKAIQFHQGIGAKRKEERLRYLKNYWVEKVSGLPRVRINTPLADHQSCGIANVAIDGMDPTEVAQYFFDQHRVFTVAVDMGVRVAPNLFTRLSDLDTLVTAIRSLSAR